MSLWDYNKTVSADPYIWAYIPDHPKANENGYVPEHRVKVENDIGRKLNEDEQVHHKDGEGANNSIENLQLVTEEEHKELHRRKQIVTRVVFQCMYCGKIFTRRRGMTHLIERSTGKTTSCSRSCGSKVGHGTVNYDKNFLGKVKAKKKYFESMPE